MIRHGPAPPAVGLYGNMASLGAHAHAPPVPPMPPPPSQPRSFGGPPAQQQHAPLAPSQHSNAEAMAAAWQAKAAQEEAEAAQLAEMFPFLFSGGGLGDDALGGYDMQQQSPLAPQSSQQYGASWGALALPSGLAGNGGRASSAHLTRGLECPITREVFQDPVVAADGVTYERAAISGWMQGNDTSPMTSAPLSHGRLTVDEAMRVRVAQAAQRGVLPALRALRA